MLRKQTTIRSLGRSVLTCVEVMAFTVCFFRLRTGAGIFILTQAMPWGYLMFVFRAQFARRDNVYFQSGAVKDTDAFIVICNIASSPVIPVAPSSIPRQPVPKVLLETLGSLLDDPLYSDVEFVFPRRGRSAKNPKKIWANRKLIERADYFKTSE
jgi:hypothetical protein